jgi:hypothetical protein
MLEKQDLYHLSYTSSPFCSILEMLSYERFALLGFKPGCS